MTTSYGNSPGGWVPRCGFIFGVWAAVFAQVPCARAQLADTIWEGNLTISNLSGQQVEEGALKYPALQGGKLPVPVEIWFWNNGEAWLMFDNVRWGLLDRPRFDPWLPRGPESSRWLSSSTYSFRQRSKNGTFQGKSTRLVGSTYHYAGYFISWSGRFSLRGTQRMEVDQMAVVADSMVKVLRSSADPRHAPNGVRFSRYPTFGPKLILAKTDRKPSQAVPGVDWD